MKMTEKAIARKRRESLVENGAYDGRFTTKVIDDKRKKSSKRECRKYDYRKNA
jgi:hypothetical protein